ncbi:MAG: phospholipase D family protein [Anaerolineales bacterium]|nr:phospholipase D family protein [Anaerolineales bacterium]
MATNMLDLIRPPQITAFNELINSINARCTICSPYITFAPVKMLLQAIAEKKSEKDVQVDVITDISLRTLVQGATEISALLYLYENHPKVSITYLPRIHAKVYIANESSAIVTSANFTDGGLLRNFEYGVKISDKNIVRKICDDVREFEKLGASVTVEQLKEIEKQVGQIKNTIKEEQKSIRRKIKLESKKLERVAEDNLIRVRVKNKSVNAIFSETVLYFLSQKPMSTQELHLRIKDIHSDLCDDTVDRIIDGKHYGKLWKHQVRNAQVTLRKAGLIYLNEKTQLWHKTT